MSCLIPRKLLLQVGFAALSFPALASGQIFARAALDGGPRGNASCGLQSCTPRTWSYGYYHEHWRRWPEEPKSTVGPDALSPFAKPDHGIPTVDLPEPRAEESMAPQRPPAGAAQSRPATTPRPTAPQVLPQAPPAPERQDAGSTPPGGDELPFAQPAQEPEQGGFFPAPDEPDLGELPESFPQAPADTALPPMDTDSVPPTDEFDLGPAENEADDVFNLDDFGQVNPQRLQRYRMSSSSQMRRPGSNRPRPTSPATVARPAPVQLAAYRQTSGSRRNPLRNSRAVQESPTPNVTRPPTSWPTEPIAVAPVEQTEPAIEEETAPLEWSQPVDAPRRFSGRANPLR